MQNRLPLVSVVIPMYKSKPYINACINSVLKINYPCYEILVIVDGNDTDTYYQVVSKFKNKKLKVFLSKKRLWLAGARSLGFKKSKGKYVALLDHDVEVASDWLDEHIAILEEDKSVVATQGKTLDINQRKIIQTTAIRLYKQFMWVKCVGFGEEDKGQYVSKEYSLAGATNVVFRKSVVAKFGFYDEKLRFNIDDLDLAIRLWVSGYKTVTATRSIIYHWTAKSSKLRGQMINKLIWEYEFAKTIRIVIKNYSLLNVFRYLPLVIFMLFLRGLYNLFQFKFMPIIGFALAFAWNIFYIKDTLEQRKIVQSRRKFADSVWMDFVSERGNVFSIVWDSIWYARQKVKKVFLVKQ